MANSVLTTLILDKYSIGPNGAQALSEALKTNSTLTTLHLQSNAIGPNGAQALGEVLKTNSTLTTLNLDRNSIGDNGAQALSDALKTNSTLTTLKLWSNKIGDDGAQALIAAKEFCNKIRFLDAKTDTATGSTAIGFTATTSTLPAPTDRPRERWEVIENDSNPVFFANCARACPHSEPGRKSLSAPRVEKSHSQLADCTRACPHPEPGLKSLSAPRVDGVAFAQLRFSSPPY
ncbi:hypothetical protein EDD21DRAFT_359438 [Dissophora ornata]|nr:hypothetical protein EDD21DRAFT_359438 [Dissophora ornata]